MAQDIKYHSFSQSVQLFSRVRLCSPMDCSMPGLPVHHQLPEFTQTHVHCVSDAIQPSHPLSSPSSLPSIFPSIRVIFFYQVAKVLELQLQHQSSQCMDWLDLLAVQGTLKSFLQHDRSKASVLQHSAFFIIQLSHPYMTTGKTTVLTRWTFVGKLTSLL